MTLAIVGISDCGVLIWAKCVPLYSGHGHQYLTLCPAFTSQISTIAATHCRACSEQFVEVPTFAHESSVATIAVTHQCGHLCSVSTIAVTHRPRAGSAASWLQSEPGPHQGAHHTALTPAPGSSPKRTRDHQRGLGGTAREKTRLIRTHFSRHHQIALVLVAYFTPVIRG